MCSFILSQHLSMSDMVSIFLNGDSRMFGLTFTFSFFLGGFARGLIAPRLTSSGYSPVSLVLLKISDMFMNSWFDPYFKYSAWTPSGPVALLFLSFCDAFWISSGVNGGSIFSGVTDICVSSDENRSAKNCIILDIWSSPDAFTDAVKAGYRE